MPLFPMKCVVVPIDLTESSAVAWRAAIELVSDPADTHVLNVVLPSSTFSPEGEWAPLQPGEVVGSTSRRRLADYVKQHHFNGVTQVVLVGDPGTEVANYARKQDADLIVIPSHGYHGIKRMMLGSVAEQLIRHCDCAV